MYEVEIYQLLVTDLKTLQQYRQDLVVAKFYSGLDSSLLTHMRGQILAGDSVPSLTTYSRGRRVFVGSISTIQIFASNDRSALFSGRGRGHGRRRDRDSGQGRRGRDLGSD